MALLAQAAAALRLAAGEGCPVAFPVCRNRS